MPIHCQQFLQLLGQVVGFKQMEAKYVLVACLENHMSHRAQ